MPPPTAPQAKRGIPSLPHWSYYDKRGRQGAALIRARKPYLIKNMVTGIGLFAVTCGIYAYTIKVIGQEEFDDVVVPDQPVRASQQISPKTN